MTTCAIIICLASASVLASCLLLAAVMLASRLSEGEPVE